MKLLGRILLWGVSGLLLLALVALLTAAVLARNTQLAGETLVADGQPRNVALYVAGEDDTPLAVDVWLPADYQAGDRLPTVMSMTRYWRATHIGWLQRAAYGAGLVEKSPDLDSEVVYLNNRNFVVVHVDARGTGASGGNRESEWSPGEVADFGHVAAWAASQPWSNGNVGAMGVSYAGNTAELLAATGESSVKAVAPLYDDFDPQMHNAQPGGAFNSGFISMWGHFTELLDRNDVCTLADLPSWACPFVGALTRGVKPVDADPTGERLAGFLATRFSNPVLNALDGVEYRDDAMKDSGGLSLGDVSPWSYRAQIEAANIPMLVMAGWMDAATVDGTLARYQTFGNPQEVYIGAWTHGGDLDTDPFAPPDAAADTGWQQQLEIVCDFFDRHLRNPGGQQSARFINYYTMGRRSWRTTTTWPPLHHRAELPLLPAANDSAGQPFHFNVDFNTSSGESTRWHTQMGGSDVVYPSELLEQGGQVRFDSPPLAAPLEITGTPVIGLRLAVSGDDGLVIGRLQAVSPEGTVALITEGVLRLRHWRAGVGEVPYVTQGPQRTFLSQAGSTLTPGQYYEFDLPLIATSVEIPQGYALRVALTGADRGLFDPIPADETIDWTLDLESGVSRLNLPVRESGAKSLEGLSMKRVP